MMHFGKLVKKVAFSRGLCAEELAELMGCETRRIILLYEEEQWLSGDIVAASMALNYNFGKFFDRSSLNGITQTESNGELCNVQLNIKYPRGKEILMRIWINKILLIAKTIGLEVE